MKREIDLTERNYFSNADVGIAMTRKWKKHRYLPWERAGSSEPARLKQVFRLNTNTEGMHVISTTTTGNSSIESVFSTTGTNVLQFNTVNIDHIQQTLMSGGSATILNDGRTILSWHDDNYFNWKPYGYDVNSLLMYKQRNMKINERIFPCGNKEYIKKTRLNNIVIDKYKKYREPKYCNYCGHRIKNLPWREMKTNMICEHCIELEKHIIYFNYEKEDIKTRYSRLKNRWRKSIRGRNINKLVFTTVPCLSSEIESEFNIRKVSKRFIAWNEYFTVYDEIPIRPVKKIYYKGKSRIPLRGTRTLWQPKGRIRQSYDRIFDSMNWRKMLNKVVEEKYS